MYLNLHLYMSHALIHSSINGPIGCFHVLAVVNNAAINIGVQIPFPVSVFTSFEYNYPEGELMDYVVVLCLVLGGPSTLFAVVAVPPDNPTNSVQGFLFLHIIANT